MAFGGMARSMRQMKSVSLAAMLACCITLVAAPAAMAGSGEPASNVFRKKVTESHAPAAQNWSHGSAMVGKATTVSRVVNDGSVSPFLAPDSAASMQKVADKYAAIVSAGGWPRKLSRSRRWASVRIVTEPGASLAVPDARVSSQCAPKPAAKARKSSAVNMNNPLSISRERHEKVGRDGSFKVTSPWAE